MARFGTGTTATTYNYWYAGNDVGSFIEQQGNTTTAGSDKFRIQSSKSGLHNDYSQFIIDPNNGFAFLGLGAGNGNVGIGITTPFTKFYVRDAPDEGLPVAFIENTHGTGTSYGLYIRAGSNTNAGAHMIRFLRPDGIQIGAIQQFSATTVNYSTTSDKRLKNIIDISQKGLTDLMKINIYDYTFNSDPDKKIQTGFMAQELYEIFPQAVSKPGENNEPAEKNPWMVDYGSVTPLIIRSVQEQQQMIDELKKSNHELKKQNAEMKSRLEKVEVAQSGTKYQPSKNSQQSTTDGQQTNAVKSEQNLPNP